MALDRHLEKPSSVQAGQRRPSVDGQQRARRSFTWARLQDGTVCVRLAEAAAASCQFEISFEADVSAQSAGLFECGGAGNDIRKAQRTELFECGGAGNDDGIASGAKGRYPGAGEPRRGRDCEMQRELARG